MNTSLPSILCVILVSSVLSARSEEPPALEASSLIIKDAEGHQRGFFGLGPNEPGEVSLSLNGLGDVEQASRICARLVGDDALFEMRAHAQASQPSVMVDVGHDAAIIDLFSGGHRLRVAARHETGVITVYRAGHGPDGKEDGTMEMVFHVGD